MTPWMEALTLVGAFMGASMWVMRFGVQQQKSISDRFIHHLETMLREQILENRRNRSAIRQLTGAVRRNSQLIERLHRKESDIGAECDQGNDKEQVQDKRNGL